jgi:hypothetical protein
LKRIPNWRISNQVPFRGLLSNQSHFLVMFPLFVSHVFHCANGFHPFHLKQITG